jgi:hypothetical protein
MAELEATCARLAAISMTPAERQKFQRLHERMGELIERDLVRDFGEMNDAFHVMVYRGAHNRYLEEIASGLRRRLSLYRRSQFRTEGRLPLSHDEHDAIVKAIISGDPARAHATMLHHLDQVETAVERLLACFGEGGIAIRLFLIRSDKVETRGWAFGDANNAGCRMSGDGYWCQVAEGVLAIVISGSPICKRWLALLTPCRRQIFAVGTPASFSFKIAMICFSLNLLHFILVRLLNGPVDEQPC